MGMYVSMCMCRPMLKRYGADQTKKVGAFRAERTVKNLPLKLIELEKMGAFRKGHPPFLLKLIELKK